jgi:hypothetical protein
MQTCKPASLLLQRMSGLLTKPAKHSVSLGTW